MTFPRHSSYRDSGVEWLGEVPNHWKTSRLAGLFREVAEPGNDDLPVLSVSIHDGVSDEEISSTDAGDRKIVRSEDRSKYKRVLPNDLVYNMMRAWQGGFGTVQVEGAVSPAYVVARPRSDMPSKFVEHLLRTPHAVEEMRRRSRGVTDFRLRLYWDEFKNIPVPLPPSDEIAVILHFLDRETAKIDALVAEQRRLIELLKEKRQAVISHAVTKGLDPTAPMRDSDIEWLGQIPAHWEVWKFSRGVVYQEGPGIMADDFQLEGVPLLRVSGAQGRWASLEGCNFLDPAKVAAKWSHFQLREGDLVISGSASMGTVCEVGPDTVGAVPYTGLIRLNPKPGVLKDYIRSLVISNLFLVQIDALKAGATIQHFGPTHLARMFITVPPIDEQRAIAARLAKVETDFAALISEAESAETLLLERRAALITAAVTGKIDVLEFAKIGQAEAA